jgi:S-formylglutathione hydrolase FrmB
VGAVACQRVDSAAVGGITAFSYYVPEACARRSQKCPVVYLLHGTGGSYRAYYLLGAVGEPTPAIVAALTSEPPVDPNAVSDPWTYNDPTKWVAAPALDMVLIAPHNKTVPGGYGPEAGVDGLWADWNPRYARDGDRPAYATLPPKFESMVVDELVPYVEAHFPVGRGREHRALFGISQGALGVLKFGLQHPDMFSALNPVSGASIPFGYAQGSAQLRGILPGVGSPVAVPRQALPGVAPGLLPQGNVGTPVDNLVTGVKGYVYSMGDPAADEAYWRGNTTQDLAGNARAWAGAVHSLATYIVNGNVVPRPGDTNATGIFLEAFANYISLAQRNAFDQEGVPYTSVVHPGTHDTSYQVPFFRDDLETLYANLRHADGGGNPAPWPSRFDYRSIRNDFTIWNWRFNVERETVEFLNVRDATCDKLTLQGSGSVTVTVPEACGSGRDGSSTFTVDLGPSAPTDEHTPAGTAGAYGHKATIALSPL